MTESRTTQQFWRLFSNLPVSVQAEARRAYRLFSDNPAHRSLRFKKLEGQENIYSIRIGLGYRALAVLKENRLIWYWIGSHSDYDRLA